MVLSVQAPRCSLATIQIVYGIFNDGSIIFFQILPHECYWCVKVSKMLILNLLLHSCENLISVNMGLRVSVIGSLNNAHYLWWSDDLADRLGNKGVCRNGILLNRKEKACRVGEELNHDCFCFHMLCVFWVNVLYILRFPHTLYCL